MVESGYMGYEGDGFIMKDLFVGIVKFIGDELSEIVDWGCFLDVYDACLLFGAVRLYGAAF